MSKTHCIIKLENDGWVLTDGNGKRPSSNGTWIYAGEEIKIYDGMIFKANYMLI